MPASRQLMDDRFYNSLCKRTVKFLRSIQSHAIDYVRHRGSPLRALCLEFSEQSSFNVRVETELDWTDRNEIEKTFHLIAPGDVASDRELSLADVIAEIERGVLGPDDICRRSASYREYSLRRLFPQQFGLDAVPARDLSWEYSVGDFEDLGDMPDPLFELLDDYWEHYDEKWGDLIDEEGDDETYGEGENWTYRKIHRDERFISVLREGLSAVQNNVLKIPHTADFIAFVIFTESNFLPDDVVFGKLQQS